LIYNVSFNPFLDSGWVPNGWDGGIYLEDGVIWDLKFQRSNPSDPTDLFLTTPIGGVIYSRTQDVRLILQDCFGQNVICPYARSA
jgi:hypothetical protein